MPKDGPSLASDGASGFLARPPYQEKHSGPCIIAGSALCVLDDLAAARQRLGWDVLVFAINGAARELKADFLYSHHADRFESRGWIRNQRRLFGGGFTVHSRNRARYPLQRKIVDYWWDVDAGGGSAWEARKVAATMGFELVVLCGCPLEAGPYRGHKIDGLLQRQDVADSLFHTIETETAWHQGCKSMSGRTRALLGSLP